MTNHHCELWPLGGLAESIRKKDTHACVCALKPMEQTFHSVFLWKGSRGGDSLPTVGNLQLQCSAQGGKELVIDQTSHDGCDHWLQSQGVKKFGVHCNKQIGKNAPRPNTRPGMQASLKMLFTELKGGTNWWICFDIHSCLSLCSCWCVLHQSRKSIVFVAVFLFLCPSILKILVSRITMRWNGLMNPLVA